jgi:hypothetical protein
MKAAGKKSESLEFDYFRKMIRKPPSVQNPAAHLAWVRIMAKVLLEMDQWVPLFTTALCAKTRSIEMFRSYCEERHFERAYTENLPRVLCFLEHYFATGDCQWLKDVGRCELWFNSLRQRVPIKYQEHIAKVASVEALDDKQYIVVSHDALETLQQLLAFNDLGLTRAGRLLWFLDVDPIYPITEPVYRAGAVIFFEADAEPGMYFTAIESLE